MTWTVSSPEETQEIGAALARALVSGDVVALSGGLGAGKTCFVQGLARGLGVPAGERIGSPTFTIVNEHSGRVALYHIDLYRIESEQDLEEIGLQEYLFGAGVAAVEWFERFPAWRPREGFEVELEILEGERRRLTLRARGADPQARLAAASWPASGQQEG